MAERPLYERLNEIVEAMMANPDLPPPSLDERLAALLRLASDLSDLPSADFKQRLKTELLSRAGREASADLGPPLRSMEDIQAGLERLAVQPKLQTYDLRAALHDLPELSMRFLLQLDQYTVGVSRFSGASHWEMHPTADEMLHFLEGEAEITTLTEEGPLHSVARQGSIFICPQGFWHRISPCSPVAMLFATPGEGTEHSDAPTAAMIAASRRVRTSLSDKDLVSHDIAAALRSVSDLKIRSDTTAAEADAAFCELADLSQCSINVGRFVGRTPWERHLGGDELLHVLDGEVDIEVLTDEGPVRRTLGGGSLFVCPRGLWHRQQTRGLVTGFFATPKPSEISWADDPRAP